ncbi:MAG: Flp pilus assembly complex ATPase component TadA [Phycisphaerae bacterium]|nr:Flp pilus assembly complex ATPase component TadA [Phycisphaerae bacterium]
MQNSMALLAQFSSVHPGYFNYVKIAAVLVLFVLWCYLCQWVDRDTDVVKTKREQWNLIVLAGGIAGLLVCLLPPWSGASYFIGLSFWVVLAGASALAYVFHRNGRVVPDARVLTWNHIKGVMARAKGDKQAAQSDKGLRIHLANFEGKAVHQPEDLQERQMFDAVQDFVFDVLWRRSSLADVLVTPERTRVFYKIDGVVAEQPQQSGPPDHGERLLRYLKRLGGLNPEERRRPQKGRVKAGLLGDVDLGFIEIQTSGSTQGERLRLRVQTSAELRRLADLGLAGPREEIVKELIREPHGIVLFSGPPESGVTTTQYAVLREHDAFMQNIYTLERRPLLDIDNITQHTYKGEGDEGVSYARMLQTVLRREPDIVMVGECADRDSAQIAANAADEKKLYVGMEARSAIEALARLMAMVEDSKLVAQVMVGSVSQRLVRKLCPACRVGYRPDPAKLKKLNLPVDKIETFYSPPTEPVYDKKGREIICQTCQGSGYVGRTGLFEVLKIDENIRAMIADNAPLKLIKAQSRKARMHYLMEEGLLKVIEGVTSMDEILRGLRDEPGK